jgi:hypothetical protein
VQHRQDKAEAAKEKKKHTTPCQNRPKLPKSAAEIQGNATGDEEPNQA